MKNVVDRGVFCENAAQLVGKTGLPYEHGNTQDHKGAQSLGRMIDLISAAFLTLRSRFFDSKGQPLPFGLRDKLNTQDDPFDEFLATEVFTDLPAISCVKASGPLITPDMVLHRPMCLKSAKIGELVTDVDQIVAIEVKKLERTTQGSVARASGLDYNTTPPSGQVRVYDAAGNAVHIRSFYLFVCLEADPAQFTRRICTALTLVDGDILNADFELYLKVTGEREKWIGLGTYGDGTDRARPMLIFANPLGAREFDYKATLVRSESNLASADSRLRLIYQIERTVSDNEVRRFYCYCLASDSSADETVTVLRDPFPIPDRDTRTRPRGRFRLPFRIETSSE